MHDVRRKLYSVSILYSVLQLGVKSMILTVMMTVHRCSCYLAYRGHILLKTASIWSQSRRRRPLSHHTRHKGNCHSSLRRCHNATDNVKRRREPFCRRTVPTRESYRNRRHRSLYHRSTFNMRLAHYGRINFPAAFTTATVNNSDSMTCVRWRYSHSINRFDDTLSQIQFRIREKENCDRHANAERISWKTGY